MTDRPESNPSAPRVAAIVLAAGRSSRFGTAKLLARLGGRSVLQHVLEVLAVAGIEAPLVVTGADVEKRAAEIDWRGARRLENPEPERGLSHSLQLGWAAVMAASPEPEVVVVALGDQPGLDPATIRRLLAEPLDPARPVISARHADGSRNPVRLEAAAGDLVAEATGDRGLGPLIDRHPERVRELVEAGTNPDVDVPADLENLIAAEWASRVRANAEQVERVRSTPEQTDFYAPVTRMFVVDPARRDDPVLDALLALARPGETWLDIGAGAGRYALPMTSVVGRVVAVDPSASMLRALEAGALEAGITKVEAIRGRWPPDAELRAEIGTDPIADVALIAHVGYDHAAITPFVDAIEASARRLCVAVLMVKSPAAVAAPFWPLVHGETRIALPALAAFVELMEARGARPEVSMVASERRRWSDRDELRTFLRRQLWTVPGTAIDDRLDAAIDKLTVKAPDGSIELARGTAREIGIVTWSPRAQPGGFDSRT